MNEEFQTTIVEPLVFNGIGLHTGQTAHLRLEPADADSGLWFELAGQSIAASASYVSATARNTELTSGEVAIHTVEHVLSALNGMGVDNVRIVLNTGEPPALDGSSGPIASAIARAGRRILSKPRKYASIAEPIVVNEKDAVLLFLPSDNFKATYILDYDHPMVGRQSAHFGGDADEYLSGIAPARTFGFIEEVEALRRAGLALGGSTDNAVVVYPDHCSSALRFKNEFARHKLLDLIGDMCLLGHRLKAHCIGIRSGHSLNISGVKEIARMAEVK